MKVITAALILVVLCLTTFQREAGLSPDQASLVAAERAFAKLTAERGVREGFITYFAEDGVGFSPHPHNVCSVLGRQPPETAPSSTALKWSPAYGGISAAGDLGYNTGPTVFEDLSAEKRPARHGLFFSVWKKQRDGSWRVVLDLGADTPSAVASLDAPFQPAPRARCRMTARPASVEEETARLLRLERDFFSVAKTKTAAQAYAQYLAVDARIHRPGVMPAVGKDPIRVWLNQSSMTLTGEPVKADVASSTDLGYAYGSYEQHGARPEHGYYARVWQKQCDGQWKIVLETVNSVPPLNTEAAFNAEGYRLLQEGKTKEAIEIFRQAVARYPNSANTYDSLSDAYEAAGNKELAIEFAQKALDLLTKDSSLNDDARSRIRDSATQKLKRLKGQ